MDEYISASNEITGWESMLTTVTGDDVDLFSIDDIEQMLMKDDADVSTVEQFPVELPDDFFSDLFLDSLLPADLSDDGKNSNSNSNSGEEKGDDVEVEVRNRNKQLRQLVNQNASTMEKLSTDLSDDFVSDLFVDSPAWLVDMADDGKNSSSNSNSSSGEEKGNDMAVEGKGTTDKKQLRQLRNRDAAVRSRERKKVYVKDLEMKSRYFEGECRRLGMLLQCCTAENQALRFSLQNAKAYDASTTKQESAVLFLESLLMGSLLWFLGIVCLFNLPRHVPLPKNVGDKVQEGLVLLRKPLNHDKLVGIRMSQLFIMSRRCKSSRSRMKLSSLCLGVFV